ncbi:class I SAM-dependent methyltransferase [Actinomadura hibisca]|uniref:class I SAM-dependent methyltransferase n=1 Tax=Actinomadura hibisca TaxID=68565 RepID=UPI0008359A22|nr:class I SAM-dependent methyltransferase [Actinomadura hibisca]
MDTVEIERVVEIENGNWWHRERRALLTRELRRLGDPGHAVDIGAGGGGVSRLLMDQGWEVTAVDGSATAVELCAARGVAACRADARWLPLPSEEYDLALALGVLAHVDDDGQAAAEIARVLRPGGAALVSVPADMALWSAHDVALSRVRRYSRAALAEVLAGAGLLVERVWSWNVLVRPIVRWMRHRRAHCEDLGTPPVAVDRLLAFATAVEQRLPVRSWPGVTLFAWAHRPD